MKLRVKKAQYGKYRAQYKGWFFWSDCYGKTISMHPEHISFRPTLYASVGEAMEACLEYEAGDEIKAEEDDVNKVVWKNY